MKDFLQYKKKKKRASKLDQFSFVHYPLQTGRRKLNYTIFLCQNSDPKIQTKLSERKKKNWQSCRSSFSILKTEKPQNTNIIAQICTE